LSESLPEYPGWTVQQIEDELAERVRRYLGEFQSATPESKSAACERLRIALLRLHAFVTHGTTKINSITAPPSGTECAAREALSADVKKAERDYAHERGLFQSDYARATPQEFILLVAPLKDSQMDLDVTVGLLDQHLKQHGCG
jgi:hypothetical protein